MDLLKTLRERARADYNLLEFERSFYKKLRSTAGPDAFNVEVRLAADCFFFFFVLFCF